jgi:hypothetical protein
VFGSGPLAARKIPSADGSVTLQYPRFARARAPAHIVLEPHGAVGNELAVHLDQALAAGLRVTSISPKPVSSGPDATGVVYLFALAPAATGTIDFQLQPETPGVLRGNIGLNGANQSVTQIIWP